jgi:uncharacterized protein (UPF0276 family)
VAEEVVAAAVEVDAEAVVVADAEVAVDAVNLKMMKNDLHNIPFLGNGIGFRPELKSFIFLNKDKIDFVEIIADHYIDVPDAKMRELDLLMENFTVIPHAINLSLGTVEGLDMDYVHKLAALIQKIKPPYWSEHIAYTQAHGYDIGHLAPVIYNEEFLEILQKNIAIVKEEIRFPFILENITYHIELPGKNIDDADFLNRICDLTACGLLLDITNLFINSKNLKFDPFDFIDRLNPDHIVQLHYVGFEGDESQLIDTHAKATQKEIYDLMAHVFKRRVPRGVLLERDDRYELLEEITEDLMQSKRLLKTYRP